MPEKSYYSVVLNQPEVQVTDMAAIMKKDSSAFIDGCTPLEAPQWVNESTILHFPEIGVIHARLDDHEAEALRAHAEIRQVRKMSEWITSHRGQSPLVDELALDAFFPATFSSVPRSMLPRNDWNVGSVKAEAAWQYSLGTGVRVAIIDSGISKGINHLPVSEGVSFAREVIMRTEPSTGEVIMEAGNPVVDWDDDHGHGTWCASIVGSRLQNPNNRGVAPECELIAVKTLVRHPRNRDETIGHSSWALAGMIWCARNNIDIVSMSLWDPTGADTPDEEPAEDYERGAQLLVESGTLVVGIAGNSGEERPNHWVTNPGRCKNIIAVGGTNRDNSLWFESSFGPSSLPPDQGVELVAPCTLFPVTGLEGQREFVRGGTSFAAPHVAGAAALIKAKYRDFSPREIRTRLRLTAVDLGNPFLDEKFGFGLLDCHAAVSSGPINVELVKIVKGVLTRASVSGSKVILYFLDGLKAYNLDWIDVVSGKVSVTDSLPAPQLTFISNSIGRNIELVAHFKRASENPYELEVSTIESITVG